MHVTSTCQKPSCEGASAQKCLFTGTKAYAALRLLLLLLLLLLLHMHTHTHMHVHLLTAQVRVLLP